ncbi:formin-like protein 5 [Dorcoceras hygrometricum]|uniref:Formin-like protein n=1 Tax=Dorcoceras hygrometricum TaxID=472368 RepID=A0A2Z7BET8_9LAMI|nr:formin-like protein 5 [Dorcoceras hygrometricum]
MKIQEMKTSGMKLLMAFVVLVLSMVSPGVGSKRDEQESSSLHYGIHSWKAELLNGNCRLELLHAKKYFRDLKLPVKEGNVDLFTSWSSRTVLVTVNPSRMERIAQNCLNERFVVPNTRDILARHYYSTGRKLAHTLEASSDVQSNEQKMNKRTVVIDVAVTAFVTFVASALLFLCWRRFGRRRNDKSKLHSSSSNDCSIGTQINGEGNKVNQNKISSTFYLASHSVRDSKVEFPVGTFPASTAYSAGEIALLQPKMAARFSLPTPPPQSPVPPTPSGTPPSLPSAKPSCFGPCHSPPIPSDVKTGPLAPPPCPPTPPPRPLPKTSPHSLPPGAPITPPRPPPPHENDSHAPPCAPFPPPRQPPEGLKSAPAVPSHPLASGPPTAKLKPFFWDKILANPDHSMVWHQVKSGSFKFNEEMIEKLFGHTHAGKNQNDEPKRSSAQVISTQQTRIIDSKKSQNLSILLKALNVTTEEICDALAEGTELPPELIQILLKMAPTAEEETTLRQYMGKVSQLTPAERLLKALVDIPFAFKRLESMLFMCTLHGEMLMLKESFIVLEEACTELRNSRLFLKLLEAVLKTGNRLNNGTFRGSAEAFKLDTLLKLSDVKGTDGETTLLHFIVREIVHSEGKRFIQATRLNQADNDTQDSSQNDVHSIGLRIVSGLGRELEHVKKAAALDIDSLSETVAKLGNTLVKVKDFWSSDMNNLAEENGFHRSLKSFVDNAEADVLWLVEEDKRIMGLVKNASDYFHRNAGKQGLRLFVIVRDFVIIVDQMCKKLKNITKE